MWSILITITVAGVTRFYPLSAYYDNISDCEKRTDQIIAAADLRDGVAGDIECVEGWKINFTTGDYNAH